MQHARNQPTKQPNQMTESNKQPSKIQTDHACSEMLKDALPILQGLLASGHFTYPLEDGDGDLGPGCYIIDNGSNWNRSDEDNPKCFAARRSYVAVTCALEMAHQLRTQIEININLQQHTSE